MISILTTGSRGDTQPYLALALALKKLGKDIRIAAFENYRDWIEGYGLEYFPIKGDVQKALLDGRVDPAAHIDNPLKVLLSFNQLKGLVTDLQEDFFEATMGAEAVVFHPGAAIGYFAAMHQKIPAILATPFPMTATRAFPALIFYDRLRLGQGYNLITHRIFSEIMWMASRSAVKTFWQARFGRSPDNFRNPFQAGQDEVLTTVISGSAHVFPRPDDWGNAVHCEGYWFLEEEAGWMPPQTLLDFIEKGRPPVYVGFGSVGDPKQAAETTRIVIEGLQQAGERGVLATGWQGMKALEDASDDFYFIEHVPHSWLFPRMAAVVHHGGAGTTAASLRVGVPSIILPFSNDQFAWGRRVFELGVGPRPIPRKKLSASALAEAIRMSMNEDIRWQAGNLGEKIRMENGAENAARVIVERVGSSV